MPRMEALRSERLILSITHTTGGSSTKEISDSCQLFHTITTSMAKSVRISRPMARMPRVMALRRRDVS